MPGQIRMDDRWHDLMKNGLFEEALTICDAQLARRHGATDCGRPRHLQNIWNGATLAGKQVLIRCYHGLGDTLQFLRYVPMVQRIAAQTRLWIQAELIDLVQPWLPGVHLSPLHDGAPDIPFDVDVEIMELLHVFRTTVATIPPPIFRLAPRPLRRDRSPVVGLQWTSGAWDVARSIPFQTLEPLTSIPGIDCVALNLHLSRREQQKFGNDPSIDTVVGLARRIKRCDLVISVDTMAAHLSGSLGVPTWTLLKHDADWRWMRERRDSPWYPSMRLYRQPRSGAWEPVIDEVRAALLDRFVSTRIVDVVDEQQIRKAVADPGCGD